MIRFIHLFIVMFLQFEIIHPLRWSSSGVVKNRETTISLKYTSEGPTIDLAREEEIIIVKDVQKYNLPITVFCYVAGYNDETKMTYSFCKDRGCLHHLKDGEVSKNINLNGIDINIETLIPNQKGMKLELRFLGDDNDASGNYYCKIFNHLGETILRSNNIQIKDLYYWQQHLIENTANVKVIHPNVITRNDLPTTFPCMSSGLKLNPSRPSWMSDEVLGSIQWSICPVKSHYNKLKIKDKMTFETCVTFTTTIWLDADTTIRPRDITEMNNWNYMITLDGSLILFNFVIESRQTDLSYALMCYTRKHGLVMPIITYVREFQSGNIISGVLLNGTVGSSEKQLEALSPLFQTIHIHARTIPDEMRGDNVSPVAIYAKYSASPNAQSKWMHNGADLLNSSNMRIDNYKVEFISAITTDMAGNYSLMVIDGSKTITMMINLVILAPPIVINSSCMPLLKHIWEEEGTVFSCSFKGYPLKHKVEINQADISSNSMRVLKLDPYLNELQYNITHATSLSSNIITLTYTVFNLRKTLGQTKYQDHAVTFTVENYLGMTIKSSSVYTVPKVDRMIVDYPDAYNCESSCNSAKPHTFRCRFKADEYSNKELTIDHYWTINGIRLDQFDGLDNWLSPYFEIDSATKDLTMKPIRSNNVSRDALVKKSLKSTFVVCHIDLISSSESIPSFIHKSQNHPKLFEKLRAKLTLDFKPIISIGVVYLAIIILGSILLFLFIIIFIIVRCLRNKEKTYNLAKLESKYGYNAEKEIMEEMFSPYRYFDNSFDDLPETRTVSYSIPIAADRGFSDDLSDMYIEYE